MPPRKRELRDSFVDDVQRIYGLYNSLSSHITSAEESVLAEQTIVSITVALESYISELLVALITESSERFLLALAQDMKNSLLKAGYSHSKVQFLVYEGTKKVNNDDLRELILSDGDNLSFLETRMLRDYVRNNLPSDLAFDVTVEDEILIDLLKSTRNLCAHHSQKAARALSGLHKKNLHDPKVVSLVSFRALVQEEEITTRNIGNYLKQSINGLPCRDRIDYVSTYLREMFFRWVR